MSFELYYTLVQIIFDDVLEHILHLNRDVLSSFSLSRDGDIITKKKLILSLSRWELYWAKVRLYFMLYVRFVCLVVILIGVLNKFLYFFSNIPLSPSAETPTHKKMETIWIVRMSDAFKECRTMYKNAKEIYTIL